MSKDGAREKLDSARRMRSLGEVADAEEMAQSAYFLAVECDDGETAYHAHACLGWMRLWRAEYDLSFVHYREAFRIAEGYNLTRWIAPACHDMFISGSEAGYKDGTHADAALADWNRPASRVWAFVHDIYRSMVRDSEREVRFQAVDFLRQSAISATWCVRQPPPGGPWYADHRAKFDRAAVYASMAHACGLMVRDAGLEPKHLQRALNLFEMAADDLASDEGYALNLIDVARGSYAGGLHDAAGGYIARANLVASRRLEDRVVAEVKKVRQEWEATNRPQPGA